MENLKNRIENWQKSEMSKDKGNASSVWQFNRKSFNHNNGGSFRGYGLNLKKKNLVEHFKLLYKILIYPRLFVSRYYNLVERYAVKILSLIILGHKDNSSRWGLESMGYEHYDDQLLKDFKKELFPKRIYFSHNTLKCYSYLKNLEEYTNFLTSKSQSKKNILEIGAGMFNFGHLLSLKITKFNYVICDLPELIMSCSLEIDKEYLSNSFYDIFLPNEIDLFLKSKSDRKVLFITPNQLDLLNKIGLKYDLFVNHESFAEMKISVVNEYLKHVSSHMKRGALLYIINRHSRPQAVTKKQFDKLEKIEELTSFEDYKLDFANKIVEKIDPFRTYIPGQCHMPNVLYIGKVKKNHLYS